jgi:WD40 repeat protein
LLADLGRHGVGEGVCPINRVVFSSDGRTLASCCQTDGTLKLWDVSGRREKWTVRLEGTVYALALRTSGSTLAVSCTSGVRLLDVATGQWVATLQDGVDETVLCLAFSPDGATLAAAGDDRVIRLWDLAKSRHRLTLVGHSDRIESLAFTPDGKTLASGSRDGTVRFWSPVSGRELLALDTPIGMQHLTFSADGHRRAGGGSLAGRGSEVYLWSADSPPSPASAAPNSKD